MVDGVSSTTEAASRTSAGRIGLASNFETFLQLLTTQLKNQDPLSPLDSNEFTAQLTQMSGVEQQLLTNDLLTSLLAAQQGSGGLSGASNYIGKEATAAWSATELTDGAAQWSYELGTAASAAKLEVVDGSGRVVWTGDAPSRQEGISDFVWDGKTTAGAQLPDGGVYTLKVSAQNASGGAVDSQVLTRGRVTGIELYEGQPYLAIGQSIVPLSAVIALDEMPTLANAANDDGSPVANLMASLNPLKLFS
ncbi:flagellar hook assembly protein FlgD [Brevundimonas variabilis]|uniref:Basal-body rod modification protein FlgD n=1 Tax=Brevundimonas variabilis TaxID=74312 RepID=A0A7W9CLD1_9CAUL|nr:flagellar hook capping FlgD N-terminal domain-containing protein [Brevundimonas variabilis]MBB5747516.1 flagellar basal-body rod modification protein FlgD [Brevundimonas variabilis]